MVTRAVGRTGVSDGCVSSAGLPDAANKRSASGAAVLQDQPSSKSARIDARLPADKRWEAGAQRWVVPPVVFNPRGYTVDVIHRKASRAFIEYHHYSKSFPAERCSIGLFNEQRELVGVACFSEPQQKRALPRWLGRDSETGAELGRFILDPSIAFNGETWFLARAFEILLEARGLDAILSYADPLAWTDQLGRVTKREHWGTVYQASNARYAGKSSPRTRLLSASGREVPGRSISKIRNREKGWRYSLGQLYEAGAPSIMPGEGLDAWLRRVLSSFRRVRHAGNLAYVFGLTKQARRDLALLHPVKRPYPKAVRNAA